jgi:hypothetical protein
VKKTQLKQEEKQEKEDLALCLLHPLFVLGLSQFNLATVSPASKSHGWLVVVVVIQTQTYITCPKNLSILFPIKSFGFGQSSPKHVTYPTKTRHLSDGPCQLIMKCTQHLACIETLGLRGLKNQKPTAQQCWGLYCADGIIR